MSAITAESLLLFDDGDRKEILIDTNQRVDPGAVSYTHLTLPTICSV